MNTPLDKFHEWEKNAPHRLFLRQPFKDKWRTYTYAQAGDEARKIAAGLLALQLPPKSHVAILSKNCAHWMMADLAIMMCGYISVPLYPTLTAPSIRQILEHSESKAIIIGKLDQYDSQKEGIPSEMVKLSVSTYGISEENTWENWIEKYAPLRNPYQWQLDELLTIIYTSGTTGKSKGVMHSAEAFYSTVTTAAIDLKLPPHPTLFSFLPLSHIAERTGVEMVGIYLGGQISFSESLEAFPKNLADTQPQLFFAVPRLWAKFREKILEKMPEEKLNRLISLPLLGSIIKKRIRKKLGFAKATHIYSGAAPISVEMIEWFEKIGVIIFQAYGMTEDCIGSYFNRTGASRHGTVGQKLNGLQVKISAEGEIRLKSARIMRGYYKEPELTREAFDEEGFLKTGDIGEIDADGYLTITGRVKDQFKTDKGKYISPGPIELALMKNTYIEQVCVVGMGIPQPIALTILSAAASSKLKDEVIKSLHASLSEINPTLQTYEKIEKVIILNEDWTIENGRLTPTLKVRRVEVEKTHLPKYPLWYDKKGTVIWE